VAVASILKLYIQAYPPLAKFAMLQELELRVWLCMLRLDVCVCCVCICIYASSKSQWYVYAVHAV